MCCSRAPANRLPSTPRCVRKTLWWMAPPRRERRPCAITWSMPAALTVAEDNGLEPDSDFEVAVIDVLRARGYEVTPQLGVAGYRIDIAVKHPDDPGAYLAAIECDGAGYHSAVSVRDRDRI